MHPDTKSKQIEFGVFHKENPKGKKPYSYLASIKPDTAQEATTINIAFSSQTVVVLFICIILSLIATFSLGVEKGKLLAKEGSLKKAASSSRGGIVAPVQGREKDQNPVQGLEADQKSLQAVAANKASGDLGAEKTRQAQKETQRQKSGYTIQVASLKSRKSAEDLSDSLSKKGLYSFVKNSGQYVVVLAGNFQKKEEAQLALKDLRKKFNDCFIRKI